MKATSGIWSFLTRKTENLIKPVGREGGRVEVSPTGNANQIAQSVGGPSPVASPESAVSSHLPPRRSLDLVRTFSNHVRMTPSDLDVQNSPRRNARATENQFRRFSVAVDAITDEHSVYSTSPAVHFPPPSLLVRLAEREKQMPAPAAVTSSPPMLEKIRLTGEDKAGLTSLLGWNPSFGSHSESEDPSKIFAGFDAFVRHQGITVLYAEHVPSDVEPSASELTTRSISQQEQSDNATSSTISGAPTVESTDTAGTSESIPQSISSATITNASTLGSVRTETGAGGARNARHAGASTKTCVPANWRTYRYYSADSDATVGELVLDVCSAAASGAPCEKEDCRRARKEHGLDWIHAAIKVTGVVEPVTEENTRKGTSEDDERQGTDIWMWSSCATCGKKTQRVEMSDGTLYAHDFYHYHAHTDIFWSMTSFGKFLELVIYSNSFATLQPTLCEHTTDNPEAEEAGSPIQAPKRYPVPSLPKNRFNIRRHFEHRRHVLSFSSAPLDSSVFEVKIPRVQIVKTPAEVKKALSVPQNAASKPPSDVEISEEQERDRLRLEITYWWGGLKDHVVKLVRGALHNVSHP